MATASRVFLSELPQLAAMREFVGEICNREWARPVDETVIRQIQLAVSEAAANAIEHAYEGETGRPIELTLQANADQIRITLSHNGGTFDPRDAAPPEFDGSREGGFGVYMMEQLMDQVLYFQEADGRSAVRLVKNRTPPVEGETHGFER